MWCLLQYSEGPANSHKVYLEIDVFSILLLNYFLCIWIAFFDRVAAEGGDLNQKEELSQLIDLVNEAPPLSAMGLFDVSRSTLTSIFGTILTYLIITIQFQMDSKK